MFCIDLKRGPLRRGENREVGCYCCDIPVGLCFLSDYHAV